MLGLLTLGTELGHKVGEHAEEVAVIIWQVWGMHPHEQSASLSLIREQVWS